MDKNDRPIALKIDNVSKDFLLPHERVSSIKGAVVHFWKHRRKRTVEVQHALHNISFEVKRGEFFGVLGRNGSGKSTLLKIMAGIYTPTKGAVKVDGQLVPFIELGVGFNPELTGRENVYLNGALLGFSKLEIDQQYDQIVEFAELEDFMDQKLKNYSSGMQVRLAFSVAIIADADILLVDEVLAVGDADFQRKCFEYFKQLKRDKKTVIFVSHDMGAVQQYCDRAVLIEKSKIVDIGKATKISTMYSKMFLETQKEDKPVDSKKLSASGEERWGDNWARWTKVRAELHKPEGELEPDYIDVVAEGIAHQDVDYPIFGFSIKNADFLQLTGTNTVRKSIKLKPLKSGEKFTVSWRVPNTFNSGKHYIDCTIAHDQATQVSDRWPDAASFMMARVEDNPYPVYTPSITFTIDKNEGK